NSKRPHKALALMTPVEYILKENKNCNMWWTHTNYAKEICVTIGCNTVGTVGHEQVSTSP
ncbi:hypothetical protein, partial [Escherichia coli]|uniref:hypothetical protein n=1 Tax=Escherichia coli TaxID=562 RepID=UPI00207BAC96